MNLNSDFQQFIKKHPPPKVYDVNKKGVALFLSKLWYSIRKGLWARWNALVHYKEIGSFVKTQMDFMRASPQEVVNYCFDNPKQFDFVGMVARKSDYFP